MEEIYERTLLYDFYGELLTPRRREIYSAVVFDDMSLSEAAEAFGVSRQGIHDIVKKCDEALQEYEVDPGKPGTFRKRSADSSWLP